MLTNTRRVIEENMRWIRLPVSFASFWIAISIQSILAVQLAKIMPAAYLSLSTIAAMWLLAMFVIPFILYLVIVKVYLQKGRRK